MAKKYDPHKHLPQSVVGPVLNIINNIRIHSKVKPLRRLPKGNPTNEHDHPLQKALASVMKKYNGYVIISDMLELRGCVVVTDPFTGELSEIDINRNIDNDEIAEFIVRFHNLPNKGK